MSQYTSYWLFQKYEKRGDQDWIPVYPNVYSVDGEGSLTAVTKTDNDPACGYVPTGETIYRWVNLNPHVDYYCEECPPDPGTRIYRWTKTTNTICVEAGAKWVATFTGGTTASAECGYSSAITDREVSSDVASIQIGDCVTSIGERAFTECRSLSSVTIPNSVTSIGYHAFSWCISLSSVTIPNSVTSIGDGAFDECDSLSSVNIPSGVTSIGESAFRYCSSLSSVTIPSSVTSIGAYVFRDCRSLLSVTVEATTPPTSGWYPFYGDTNNCPIYVPCGSVSAYRSARGWSDYASRIHGIPPCDEPTVDMKWVATFTGGTTASAVCDPSSAITRYEVRSDVASIEIGYCVTSIGNYAFRRCSLTGITIPSSVTNIGNYAFTECRSLSSVTIPNSVTTISWATFAGCYSLTGITIPNSVTSIGEYAFRDCSGLTSVNIPTGVTSIESSVFSNCTSLSSINIPSSVTSIGNYAFWRCSGLSSVTIPSSVTSIGASAFTYCSSLSSVTIPNSVTSIGKNAFMECDSLSSVTVEATTPPTLGSGAFDNTGDCPIYVPCSGVSAYRSASGWSDYASRIHGIPPCELSQKWVATFTGGTTASAVCDPSSAITRYEVRSDVASIEIGYCVTSIGESAFAGCYSLTGITIPNSVTSIASQAFTYCRSLSSVTIPNSVTSIDYGAFRFCSGLTSVNIPSSVTYIGDSAFYDCYSLTGITIPNSVTSIEHYTFYDCYSLTGITIPSSVTTIDHYAFADCYSLTSITVEATTPPSLGSGVFDNTNNCPIYVPAASVNAYKSASGWSTYASRIQAIQ